MTVNGHAAHKISIKKAGADEDTIVIAVTSSDEVNLIACQLAKKEFNVKKTICRLTEKSYTDNLNVFGEDAIDVAINPENEVKEHLKELIMHPGTMQIEKFADGKERTLLALKPHLSPIKAAIIPLKRNNEEIVSKALDIKRLLQSLKLGRVLLDNSGNIGKSYRRHDEIGTPMCVTVDFQSLEDDTITIRDRDSMEQVRISCNEVSNYFQKNIS